MAKVTKVVPSPTFSINELSAEDMKNLVALATILNNISPTMKMLGLDIRRDWGSSSTTRITELQEKIVHELTRPK